MVQQIRIDTRTMYSVFNSENWELLTPLKLLIGGWGRDSVQYIGSVVLSSRNLYKYKS